MSWFLWSSVIHSTHIHFWSVRQKTSRSFSCFWQIISCSRPVASITLCGLREWNSSWRSKWVWQYDSRHTRQDLTALYFLPVQTSHCTSPAPASQSSDSLVFFSFLHHFNQHGVFPQSRSWTEGLSALRAAVDSHLILLIPAACNTDLTVTVSTMDGHWILQEIQTHWTRELILIHWNSGFCHVSPWIQRHKHTTALQFLFPWTHVTSVSWFCVRVTCVKQACLWVCKAGSSFLLL